MNEEERGNRKGRQIANPEIPLSHDESVVVAVRVPRSLFGEFTEARRRRGEKQPDVLRNMIVEYSRVEKKTG